MGNYQGPNVSVRQEFTTTPGAVSIENLPSVAVATAYDVYKKKSIGRFHGIESSDLLWGVDNKVVSSVSISGSRAYEMYPPKAYAKSDFGDVDLDVASDKISSTGVEVGLDDMLTIPNTEKVAGSCSAFVPYYKATLTTTLLASSPRIVNITGGDVVSAQIQRGQSVFILDGTYKLVGTVGSIGTDKSKITLSAPYSGAEITAGTGVLVGAANGTTLSAYPNTFYDPNGSFKSVGVMAGDILEFSSNAITGSIEEPIQASVAYVTKTMIVFNTEVLAAGKVDNSYLKYFPNVSVGNPTIASTIPVYSYRIKRLIGFSENYKLKEIAVKIAGVSGDYRRFTVSKASFPAFVIPSVGDIMMITPEGSGVVASGDNERDYAVKNLYAIATVNYDGSDICTITTVDPMNQSFKVSGSATPIATGDFLNAWKIVQETEIVSDFRAIRSENHGTVVRIGSVKDIRNAFVRSDDSSIDPRNELAFMLNIIFARNGGKVCYGVNVDSSAGNLSTEYGEALEALKMHDVYSHSFGTTDQGVNGVIGAYCDEQSEPYEAHERIGVICYDTDDLYLMGTAGITSLDDVTGELVVDGSMDLAAAGVAVKDEVELYDANGIYISTVSIIEVQNPPSVDTVITDYSGSTETPVSAMVISGRPDDQAVRVGNIRYGNRRVSMVFPGWFHAQYGSPAERLLLPPYFITACIAGMDGAIVPSQSFTNMPFSIPGLSNIELDTNFHFRKAQLDDIGGGGVDILIQDATITPTIKSRHDLTSNMDAIQYRERSITKQADVCAKTIRSAVSPYVGRYNITGNLFKFLGNVCSIACTSLVKNSIISTITVDKIERDEVIDDKINFYITAIAFVAGNYYDITLLVKTR
jgi:hypothetical protein